MAVLDALLEGFSDRLHPRGWHGRFAVGDRVRVEGYGVRGDKSIVGRVVRPSDAMPESHVVIAPEGGGPHVLAKISMVKLDSPARHAAERAKREQSTVQLGQPSGSRARMYTESALSRGQRPVGGGRVADAAAKAAATRAEILRKSPGAEREAGDYKAALSSSRVRGARQVEDEMRAGKRRPHARVRESDPQGIAVLVEAFAAGPAPPAETPGQSLAIATQQVAQAKSSLWNSAKHPRGAGGKFGYTTGGKRATRSRKSKGSVLAVGSSGAMVRSIQRQLGIPQDGIYGPQTRAAVMRYQAQHGLVVDGIVGKQTLASLRGHSRAKSVKPGRIASKTARVRVHPANRSRRAKPPQGSKAPVKGAPNRAMGGVIA